MRFSFQILHLMLQFLRLPLDLLLGFYTFHSCFFMLNNLNWLMCMEDMRIIRELAIYLLNLFQVRST